MSWPSIPSVEIALDDSVEFVDTSDGVVEEATEGGGSPDTAASEADEGEREGGGDGGEGEGQEGPERAQVKVTYMYDYRRTSLLKSTC